MASTLVLPLANYPVQSRAFGPVAIADGLSKFAMTIQRNTSADPTIWPSPGVTVALQLNVSVNGQAAQPWCGVQDSGGLRVRNGVEVPVASIQAPIPAGVNRTVSGAITIAGGALRTSATLTVT